VKSKLKDVVPEADGLQLLLEGGILEDVREQWIIE